MILCVGDANTKEPKSTLQPLFNTLFFSFFMSVSWAIPLFITIVGTEGIKRLYNMVVSLQLRS